jgi:uncharacterized radical SAM protein YgiQ
MVKQFLPISKQDMARRGWGELDVILVTGDAYCDHPSYGASVIGRVLEDAGYRVGIIAQPDWREIADFTKLGPPKLFFGVTAGNLDSMVANYTANRKKRRGDVYSPGNGSGLRPDRACIAYTNRIRQAYGCVPIVLGGLEASMRRLAHYDYWQDKVRRSVLLDSKADILVYGMGERQALEIAGGLKQGKDIRAIGGLNGTVTIRNDISGLKDYLMLPSFEEAASDNGLFNEAFKAVQREFNHATGKALIQKHADRFVIQLPPARPLSTEEMDGIYGLPYSRNWHPAYDRSGGVPGYETVRFSIISHRGCPGACSFCSLYLHQGPVVQSRGPGSILKEIELLAGEKGFGGTITDIGGPTANLYGAECAEWEGRGPCKNKKCLVPSKCKNLKLGYARTLELWGMAMKIPGVRHIFIGSGVRYDLLIDSDSDAYLKELCAHHVGGRLKTAPEHSEDRVLKLMGKPSFSAYDRFAQRFNDACKRSNRKQYLVNYFISAHPGATMEDALNLALALIDRDIYPEQIQDFLPLPMTASGCMYYTGKDPFTGKQIYAAKGMRDRKLQRALIQHKNPDNRKYVIEALRKTGKMNLLKRFYR